LFFAYSTATTIPLSSSDDDSDNDSDNENEKDDDASQSSSSEEDEEEDDRPLSERVYINQHEKGSSSKLRSEKADKKAKALKIASKRLAQMKSTKQETKARKKKSKHAPTESSSLRRDYYTSLNSNALNINSSGVGITIGANAYKPRDPRLQDTLSGHLDQDVFQKRYGFLEEVQEEEIKHLKERIRVHRITGRRGQKMRRKIKEEGKGAWTTLEEDETELKRLQQERTTRHKSQTQRLAKQKIKKQLRSSVISGKAGPYFPKKREWKRMELEAKFDVLHKQGGNKAVDALLKKKRKKNMGKASKFMPPAS